MVARMKWWRRCIDASTYKWAVQQGSFIIHCWYWGDRIQWMWMNGNVLHHLPFIVHGFGWYSEDPLLSFKCHNPHQSFTRPYRTMALFSAFSFLKMPKEIWRLHTNRSLSSPLGGKVTCIEGNRFCSSNVNDLCDVMVFLHTWSIPLIGIVRFVFAHF